MRNIFKNFWKFLKFLEIVKNQKKVKGTTFTFWSIWGNFFIRWTTMCVLLKTINTCQLTPKALIKLPITICSLPTYLPGWLLRLYVLSGLQKSCFFFHFPHFLFHFPHFLFHLINFFFLRLDFDLVLELFIDDLKIIFMVCIIF